MLRSLLRQLLQRSGTIPEGVDALFSSSENVEQQPSLHAVMEMTRQMLQQFKHAYVVVDALDECTQRSELLNMLETVAGWQLHNLHMLVTSRKERDIESSLKMHMDEEDIVCFQSNVVDSDIQRYIQQRLSDDRNLVKWNNHAAIRHEIEAALMRGACGMSVTTQFSALLMLTLV
jgi:hypothetical protein